MLCSATRPLSVIQREIIILGAAVTQEVAQMEDYVTSPKDLVRSRFFPAVSSQSCCYKVFEVEIISFSVNGSGFIVMAKV